MSKRIVLYHSPYSPFSRSVLLCCRFIKLDVDVRELNLLEDEQLAPEFIKINPQHCVPTIDDNGFCLWESRAILSYLMESKASHLLPATPEENAVVNQRLYFEQGGLAKKYAELYVSYQEYLHVFARVHFSDFSSDLSLKVSQKSARKRFKNFMTFFPLLMNTFFLMETSGLQENTLR